MRWSPPGTTAKALAAILVRAFLRQAVVDGFFHADLHQGNLFALPDGRIAVIDFGIMGRIDRRARMWLAEILYGLITGNYRRVAEIHFEAQYVPAHHNVEEFATALRAAGEPIRGLPVKDISVGRMLESLFAITRDFDMPTQPHLLLLQKTMVMEEGVATNLDPDINMWETAEPFLKEWLRSELGPEAYYADRITDTVRALEAGPAADPPDERILPAARRRAAGPAAARDRGDRARELGVVCGDRIAGRSGRGRRSFLGLAEHRQIERLAGAEPDDMVVVVGAVVAGAGVGEDGQAVAVEHRPAREIAELLGRHGQLAAAARMRADRRQMEMADRHAEPPAPRRRPPWRGRPLPDRNRCARENR